MRQPDLAAAGAFLFALDRTAELFTFQTFSDQKSVKDHDDPLVAWRHTHSSLSWLAQQNARGAGIFVTVNETDGQGRRAANIIRIRAVFLDLDGAPLTPVLDAPLAPHAIVESSPDRYQIYWFCEGLALDEFSPIQQTLAARYNGDPNVHDLPRVMRLPGFYHLKDPSRPFQVRCHRLVSGARYSAYQIRAAFPPMLPCAHATATAVTRDPTDFDPTRLRAALDQIVDADDYHLWIRIGRALKSLGEPGFALWEEWSQRSEKYDGDVLIRKWRGFKTHATPKTIFWLASRDRWKQLR